MSTKSNIEGDVDTPTILVSLSTLHVEHAQFLNHMTPKNPTS